MRKWVIAAVAAAVVLAAGAAGGRWTYHRMFRDPLQVARQLLAKGQVQAAALELRQAVQNHPGNAVAQVRLAAVQLMLGDPVAAERELKAARAAGYKGADLTPLLARALLAQRRSKELLADFSPDGLPPADAADLWDTRGVADLSIGNVEAARYAAEAAERLEPRSADPVLLAARAAVAQRQPGWALALLDRALALDPRLTEALLLKAGILRLESRPNEALPVLDQAVATARKPLDVAAARLSRAGALLAAGEDAKALADAEALLRQTPKSPGGNYIKALAQVRAKDWRGADVTLQVIQPLLPQLPRGEYYLALVKANVGQVEQAAEAIAHYTARSPGDPDGWRLLARIALAAGRTQEAEQALARIAGIMPRPADEAASAAQAETPQELTRLAAVQLGSGDATAAAHDLDRSLDIMPSPADVAARAVTTALQVADLDRAAAALAVLARQPNTSRERLAALTGALRLAQFDLDGARAAFAEGVAAAPASVPLKLDLARVLMLQGRAAEAEALLLPVLAQAPADATVLGTMMDIYTATGRPDRARAVLDAAEAARPHDPGLQLTDAALTARSGDIAGALARLDSVPSELQRSPRLLTMRVRLLLGEKKLKEAIEAQRTLLQVVPNDLQARSQLVSLLVADHQEAAAVEVARTAASDHPGNSALLRTYVETTYRASGLDAALKLAETLRQDPANLPASQLLKGAVYLLAGRPADAEAAFAAELATTPFGALAIAEATALQAAGKADAARTQLTTWAASLPDPTVSEFLASLDIQTRQFQAAASALQGVLAGRPDDVVALNNLAWVYQQLNDPRAEALAHRAYLLGPGAQTADTLGWILTRRGKPTVGLLLLRQAAAQLPRDPSVQYHLAVALDDAGQHEQAGALLGAIMAQKVRFDEQDAARQLLQKLVPEQPVPPAAPAQQ